MKKIIDEKAKEKIRRLWDGGKGLSQRVIALRFGVAQGTIAKILAEKTALALLLLLLLMPCALGDEFTLPSSGGGSCASIADGDIFSNISGATACPIGNTLSATLDYDFGSAQGDILYRGASAWKVLAPGTSGQVLETGGASANPAWTTISVAAAFPYWSITGYLPSSISGTHTTATTTISGGQAADSTNAYLYASSGFSWAVTNGDAANGYQGGTTLPNSSTIHFFVMAKSTDTGWSASFASTSLTPTLPSGYTLYRHIFDEITNSSGSPLAGTSNEGFGGSYIFYLSTPAYDIAAASVTSSSRTLFTLTLPAGIKVVPLIRANLAGYPAGICITSPDEADIACASSVSSWSSTIGVDASTLGSSYGGSATPFLTDNTSAQIGIRATGSYNVVEMTRGWIDPRRN